MAWIIGIGALIFLCYKFPEFRKLLGGIILLLVLATGIYYLNDSVNQKVAESLITADQIQIKDLKLYPTYSDYTLKGQIKNNSSHTLTEIDMTVTAYDCPDTEITSACETIGEDQNFINPDVPANQVRVLPDTYVNFYNMPQVKGYFLWSYKITKIIGKD
ncbi:MAG: hypothetical protein JWN50_206 [Parcubacteria group bacterium]|nr:hypothetical protein [Parcubacteria group bacterium]